MDLPDLTDPSLWRMALDRAVDRGDHRAIPVQRCTLARAIALVSVQSAAAPSTWVQAGWARLLVPANNVEAVVMTQQLVLQDATLLVLPRSPSTCLLEISFVKWLESARLTVAEFVGEDVRVEDDLARVEAKINSW